MGQNKMSAPPIAFIVGASVGSLLVLIGGAIVAPLTSELDYSDLFSSNGLMAIAGFGGAAGVVSALFSLGGDDAPKPDKPAIQPARGRSRQLMEPPEPVPELDLETNRDEFIEIIAVTLYANYSADGGVQLASSVGGRPAGFIIAGQPDTDLSYLLEQMAPGHLVRDTALHGDILRQFFVTAARDAGLDEEIVEMFALTDTVSTAEADGKVRVSIQQETQRPHKPAIQPARGRSRQLMEPPEPVPELDLETNRDEFIEIIAVTLYANYSADGGVQLASSVGGRPAGFIIAGQPDTDLSYLLEQMAPGHLVRDTALHGDILRQFFVTAARDAGLDEEIVEMFALTDTVTTTEADGKVRVSIQQETQRPQS